MQRTSQKKPIVKVLPTIGQPKDKASDATPVVQRVDDEVVIRHFPDLYGYRGSLPQHEDMCTVETNRGLLPFPILLSVQPLLASQGQGCEKTAKGMNLLTAVAKHTGPPLVSYDRREYIKWEKLWATVLVDGSA